MSAYKNEAGEWFVRVVARQLGFYLARRRPGTVFDLPVRLCKERDEEEAEPDFSIGKPGSAGEQSFYLPKWCALASDEKARAEIAAAPQRAEDHFRDAAIASSGSRGRPRRDSFVALMNKPLPNAEHERAVAGALAASGSAHGSKAKAREIREALGQADLLPEDKPK